jgi:hypothetical protein
MRKKRGDAMVILRDIAVMRAGKCPPQAGDDDEEPR